MRVAVSVAFMLIASTASAQTAPKAVPVPVVPPPPVMIAPPPPIAVAPPYQRQIPATVFQVEIMGGAERLWLGDLRVGNYGSATFNSSVSEAPETCAADKSNLGSYAPNYGRSIRVSISRNGYGYSSEANTFAVNASWTRPGTPCEERGTGTVSFERPFKMDVGGRAEFKGDGGLMVRVSRIK